MDSEQTKSKGLKALETLATSGPNRHICIDLNSILSYVVVCDCCGSRTNQMADFIDKPYNKGILLTKGASEHASLDQQFTHPSSPDVIQVTVDLNEELGVDLKYSIVIQKEFNNTFNNNRQINVQTQF